MLAIVLLGACERPVDRSFGQRILASAKVVPEHVRANVPIDVSFSVLGAPPSEIDLEIGGQTFTCAPVLHEDQRYHCTIDGLDPTLTPNGTSVVLLRARAEGEAATTISASFVFDSQCPEIANLVLDRSLAAPGERVTLRISANENLGEPPLVLRSGREWEAAAGSGREYTVQHEVTPFDPALADIVVKLIDVAGNESSACGADGRIPLAIDRLPPVAQADLIHVNRGTPGEAATIFAEAGAFMDDVHVASIEVSSSVDQGVIASFVPDETGSLARTTLPVATNARVLVTVVDTFGRRSTPAPVRETWTLGFGAVATPARAVRTASRYTAAIPTTRAMHDRTDELAPTLGLADGHAATVRAEIAFNRVGQLPGRYQNAHQIIGGYDSSTHTALAIGGRLWDPVEELPSFLSDTMMLEWAEDEGRYRPRPGPDLYLGPGQVAPSPRAGFNIAFDDNGCGMMFGGEGLYYQENDKPTYYVQDDLWELCRVGDNYRWTELIPENAADGPYNRRTPIVWDPLQRRFVIVGGVYDCFFSCGPGDDVFFLAQEVSGAWRWYPYSTLPSNFDGHIHHAAWFDERLGNVAVALGTDEYLAGTARRIWRYESFEWRFNEITPDLYYRQGFGSAYDKSRGQLVVWGGTNEFDPIPESGDMNPLATSERFVVPDPLLYVLAGTATAGPSAWRAADLNYPTPRMWPTMIYDEDRQVTLMIGGVRFHDAIPVETDIYEVVVEPAYPHLSAVIDLGASRPKGLESLRLAVRGHGAGGFAVDLWDHQASRWVESATSASTTFETVEIVVADGVDRWISNEGTVPVTVRALATATSRSESRLEVDSIRGEIVLRSAVSLP
jgi:hypothetical protein